VLSIAVINLPGVSTNKTIIYFIAMQTYKELVSQLFVGLTTPPPSPPPPSRTTKCPLLPSMSTGWFRVSLVLRLQLRRAGSDASSIKAPGDEAGFECNLYKTCSPCVVHFH
jgi:hypothetical protein